MTPLAGRRAFDCCLLRFLCGARRYPPNRNSKTNNPAGFANISHHWDGICSYSGSGSSGGSSSSLTTLCNIPLDSHSWKNVKQDPYFMCAKVLYGAHAKSKHAPAGGRAGPAAVPRLSRPPRAAPRRLPDKHTCCWQAAGTA